MSIIAHNVLYELILRLVIKNLCFAAFGGLIRNNKVEIAKSSNYVFLYCNCRFSSCVLIFLLQN